jgi:hypothetical protein
MAQYLLQSLTTKEATWARLHEVEFALPPVVAPLPFRGHVVRVTVQARGLTTLSEDGHIVIWSQSQGMLPMKKHVVLQIGASGSSTPAKPHPKWCTDFVIVPELLKIVVSTGERELWFFDLATLEPQFAVRVESFSSSFLLFNPEFADFPTRRYAHAAGGHVRRVHQHQHHCVWRREGGR